MRTRLFQALVLGLSVAGASMVMAVGCSSSSSSPSTPTPGLAQCPATIDEAIGAACTRNGEDCGISYACGNEPQQAHCLCNGGRYACTDATGADIAKGTPPTCVPPGAANDKECPAAESGTEGKACKTAGLLCSYVGLQCPESTSPLLDTCQCQVGATTPGLFFHCEPQLCIPRSDASDDASTAPDTAKPPEDAAADG